MKKVKCQIQGDVIIIERKPKEAPKEQNKEGVLAYGEVTGHSHRITNGRFEMFGNAMAATQYLKALEPVTISHEEHDPIYLPPGEYEIVKQREYNHLERAMRTVLD